MKTYTKLYFILPLVLIANLIHGQSEGTKMPGIEIVHYFPDSSQRKAPQAYLNKIREAYLKKKTKQKTSNLTTAVPNYFILNFATPPSADVAAVFTRAAEIWSQFIFTSVPIRVNINWTVLGTNILGSAGTSMLYNSFDGATNTTNYFPAALAEKLSGINFNGLDSDINASFNSNFTNWYIGVDGIPPYNKIDLLSVVLHELGHGLGFIGGIEANQTTNPAIGTYSYSCIFDNFTQDDNGILLLNTNTYPNNSNTLYNLITSNALFSSNPGILAENSVKAKLYAPSIYSSGSSIYHVDQSTYPVGNSNALMTPYIAYGEITRDLGPIVKGLFKEMAWTKSMIAGEKYGDGEFPPSGFVMKAKGMGSTYYGVTVSNVKLFVSENNGSFTSRTLTQSGDDYSFTLPYKMGNQYIRYYWTAQDSQGKTLRFPNSSNSVYSFNLSTDNTKPSVSFTNFTPYLFAAQTNFHLPPISATDNYKIAKVEAIYKINSNAEQTVQLGASSITANTFIGDLPLSNLVKGDTLYYKIKATDAAISANYSFYPTIGWIKIPIIGPKTAVNSFGQTFTNPVATDFRLKDFTFQTPTNFTSNGLGSAHPYLNGTAQSYNGEFGNDTYSFYEAVLMRPITIQAVDDTLKFDEIALVEPADFGAAFYNTDGTVNRSFNDYVIVQGSKDGGNTWKDLSAGWDAGLNSTWSSTWYAAQSNGNSTSLGIPSLIKSHVLHLKGNTGFVTGDQVLLRFRFLADPASTGWGWFIDNLRIQGGNKTTQELEIANTLPQISATRINLSNADAMGKIIDLGITDLDGDVLLYQIIEGNSTGLFGFDERGNFKLVKSPASTNDETPITLKISDGVGFTQKTLSVYYCDTVISNSAITNLNKSYNSNSTIIFSFPINSTSKIGFQSAQSITLQPGFTTQAGTVFEAKIGQGCQ